MNVDTDTKQAILDATMALIQEGTGDIDEITTRTIAARAKVGTGAVNYHFQSKENLISICVERIIAGTIAAFAPAIDFARPPVQRLHWVATQVMQTLFDQPSVSRISILSDFSAPHDGDNTDKTIRGFLHVLRPAGPWTASEKQAVFAYVAAMQAMFLKQAQFSMLTGLDVTDMAQREGYLLWLTETLFGGIVDE